MRADEGKRESSARTRSLLTTGGAWRNSNKASDLIGSATRDRAPLQWKDLCWPSKTPEKTTWRRLIQHSFGNVMHGRTVDGESAEEYYLSFGFPAVSARECVSLTWQSSYHWHMKHCAVGPDI